MSRFQVEEAGGGPFVKTTIVYDVADSTSDRAAELVRAGKVELPLVVWARCQTRGRGRGNHEWWSDTGSLTFTIGHRPGGPWPDGRQRAQARIGDGRRGDRGPG